jgi:polyphosphate kinase
MKKSPKAEQSIPRDLSWLAFNARVLQEAADQSVPLAERLRFLGIFSNNLDEFFRVRVAALNRMVQLGKAARMFLEEKPAQILRSIQQTVLEQQKEFDRIYAEILQAMKKQQVQLLNETQLSASQREFVVSYFNQTLRTHLHPIMIESVPALPLLQDRSIYLACLLSNSGNSFMNSYALIEVPTQSLSRFVVLPPHRGVKCIILLEDIIRYCMPQLFAQFGFNHFECAIIKVTRDAELDIDNEVSTDLVESVQKGLKNRKRGKAVRLVYDRGIQKNLLQYLIRLLHLTRKDHLIAGGRIHNFKDFMEFPEGLLPSRSERPRPFVHPLLTQPVRILEVLDGRDVMLHFPYHSFDSVIDLLREAAIDPFVERIRITAYRLARESKIIKALVNAVRNGKHVTVVLEVRARFDEEANLRWKAILEEEGVQVVVGQPNLKIHAKLCVITKRVGKALKHYGFVSTGNLNESTAKVYGDHCLLTADRRIMSDAIRVFDYLEKPSRADRLKACKTLILSPSQTRRFFEGLIRREVRHFKAGKPAGLTVKLNSFSDRGMMESVYEAARLGLPMQFIIRGICCLQTENRKWPAPLRAVSIVDEYLEHARVFCFVNKGQKEYFISSADWMLRNLDYRVEVTAPVFNTEIREELDEILRLQLAENVKARMLNGVQENRYVRPGPGEAALRSQEAIYAYLKSRRY